ncbi:EDD domain protein, DegV family [Marinitoga hydrogenitolerans DSM 16785]|uniref:EDD domain protein, DegV family n=1 Tax=Marinitoga hydrogenitolerans (strain DSM 16785 / JCM 12826 / AT1271) TaxID=1122195 RepID=A0A1M4UHP6_MARH1|nr:DegV family protein [Marinitoga hydrogenitolerans]SHE56178.1 EDD domain protein, DegV family [Marinitoga hydrogenitolerans DSM 16785]
MKKIGIIVDSGCDVPKEILERFDNIKVVPLRTIINDKEYDEGTFSEEYLFEHLDEKIATSLPKPEKIKNTIETMIEKGYNKIITINISKNLSGTYNLFKMISDGIMKENDTIQIVNIDSLNISIGSALVVYRAAQYIEEGKDFDEIIDLINTDIKNATVFYVVPTLKYLARGGRIGKVSAMLGQIMNIKPIISVNDEGIYYTVSKIRGFNKSIEELYNQILKFINNQNFIAGVVISGNSDRLINMQNELISRLNSINKSIEVFRGKVSSTLSAHTGPGLIGIGVLKLSVGG